MKMLEGIKVLDFTTNASGPKAGTYLADYGAEVVKVEVPGGEGGRKFAFYVNGISTYACGKDRPLALLADRTQTARFAR